MCLYFSSVFSFSCKNLAAAAIRNVKYTVYRKRQKIGEYRGNSVMLNRNLLEIDNLTLSNVPLSGTRIHGHR
jgi:hypothetical protein